MEGQSPPSSLIPQQQVYAIKTWRYLRLAMITLVVGLTAAVVYEVVRGGADCVQTSISAYYYTHAQAIFVGALVAIGACLVCLRGSSEIEDVLLNVAGMLAPVVALVPTPKVGDCASLPGVPKDPTPNIENNVTALLVMGLVAFVVLAGLSWRRRQPAPALVGTASPSRCMPPPVWCSSQRARRSSTTLTPSRRWSCSAASSSSLGSMR